MKEQAHLRDFYAADDAECLWPRTQALGDGMVTTLRDYWRFAQMLLNGGELDGRRLLSRKTVRLMATNGLPGGRDLEQMGAHPGDWLRTQGAGFGLGLSVANSAARQQLLVSEGEFSWGGGLSTFFYVDPQEEVVVVFLTQLMPSGAYPIRSELRVAVNQALID